MNIRKVSFSSR